MIAAPDRDAGRCRARLLVGRGRFIGKKIYDDKKEAEMLPGIRGGYRE